VEILRTLRFLCCPCFRSKEERADEEDELEAMSEGHVRMQSGEGYDAVPRSPGTTIVARNRLSDYESTLMSIPGDRLSQVGIAK
jgi:hypothetical protein